MTKQRVIAMICDGQYQNYLSNLLNSEHELVGIVLVKQANETATLSSRFKRYKNPVNLLKWLSARFFLPYYECKSERLLNDYEPKLLAWGNSIADVPILQVDSVNRPDVEGFVEQCSPNFICVNGTNLIRERLLRFFEDNAIKVLNLHTGLSPYSRGGNCNLFMLKEGKPEYVGGTIHWIDRGIDSGDIIYSFRPDMGSQDPFEFLDGKVFIDGMKALSRAVTIISNDKVVSVKQWEEGKLFLLKTGYRYELFDRFLVNVLISRGLIRKYIDQRILRDSDIRLIGDKSDFS